MSWDTAFLGPLQHGAVRDLEVRGRLSRREPFGLWESVHYWKVYPSAQFCSLYSPMLVGMDELSKVPLA